MLDSLLGVEEEEKRKKAEEEAKKQEQASAGSISPTAMQKLSDADAQRAGAGGQVPEIDQQFQKIIDKAKKLSENNGSEADQAQLKQEFDGLLQKISKAPEAMSKDDIKRLKEAAFGPNTFFITETQPIADLERSGLLIRGNLRDERAKVYEFVCQKVRAQPFSEADIMSSYCFIFPGFVMRRRKKNKSAHRTPRNSQLDYF